MRTPLRLACIALYCLPTLGLAQLRIANWNVTNYSSGRINEFKTAFYTTFEGRSMSPDILIGQEFINATSLTNFLSILNTAVGSPGDWSAAPFLDGADTESAFFYRTSKVTYIGTTIVALGSGATNNQPRNTYRYDFRPLGYSSTATTVACYAVHMKAGSTPEDQDRRLVEAERIRLDAQALPDGWNFLMAGDTNIQSSTQAAYQELVGSKVNNLGRFFDPIKTPGSWNNSATYKFVHTQDPAGAGGMDDRLDFILLSAGLIDGNGQDYIGNPSVSYSTTTWNDPNHSFRVWGNDGTSFNQTLKVVGNTMVGPTIAQALIDSAANGGHLPVYLDLKVPPQVTSQVTIDFGVVYEGQTCTRSLIVTNAGNTALWNVAGIANLSYSLAATGAFSAPGGTFIEAPGGGSNSHTISLNTATPGLKTGTITINSNAPDEPARVINVRGKVLTRHSGGSYIGPGG